MAGDSATGPWIIVVCEEIKKEYNLPKETPKAPL